MSQLFSMIRLRPWCRRSAEGEDLLRLQKRYFIPQQPVSSMKIGLHRRWDGAEDHSAMLNCMQ